VEILIGAFEEVISLQTFYVMQHMCFRDSSPNDFI